MRFLADMGVSQRVIAWFRAQGHDVVHLRDQGLQRITDTEIFQKASQEDRIVVTYDLDFGEIVAATAGNKPSTLILRLHNCRSDHVIARLEQTLGASEAELLQGAVVVVEEFRYRIRRLPIQP